MTITKEQWREIVSRGALVPPYYEPSRSAGNLYATHDDGSLNERVVVGYMPNTYYDKRYRDRVYYSFTAFRPDADDIGVFFYNIFDKDEGTYDHDSCYIEIDDLDIINSFVPEKVLLEGEE